MRVLGKLVLCLFAICLEVREAVTSATGTDARNLRTKLFVTDAYDKKVRPNTNQSDPTGIDCFHGDLEWGGAEDTLYDIVQA